MLFLFSFSFCAVISPILHCLISCYYDFFIIRCNVTSCVFLSYFDPHFLRSFKVNKEIDVYSFGITVLQLMFGKRKVSEVHSLWGDDQKPPTLDVLLQNLDPKAGEWNYEYAAYVLELCLRCKAIDPSERPKLKEVVGCLSKIPNDANKVSLHIHPSLFCTEFLNTF